MFSQLESRVLLASSLSGSTLIITGTTGNNTVDVSLVSGKIRVKDSGLADKNYTASQVTKIVADLKAGNDKLTLNSNISKPASLLGGTGNDTITGGSANDTIRGGDGKDSLLGGSGVDALYGDAGDDMLRSDAGNDKCFGGAGNDVMQGGTGNDNLDGGSGNDTVDYSLRKTPIAGAIVRDPVTPSLPLGGGGGETAAGEEDTYVAVETLIGGMGNDELSFMDGTQELTTVACSVLIQGGPGNDKLWNEGWRNDDPSATATLRGGDGDDELSTWCGGILGKADAGNGNDTFSFSGHDLYVIPRVDMGSGIDKLYYWTDPEEAGAPDVFSLTLPSSVENFDSNIYTQSPITISITGNASANVIKLDLLEAEGQSITIKGLDGDDTITGSKYSDYIDGGAGKDVIHGGAGNDTLIGGAGNDKLYGDAGNDYFDSKDSATDSIDGGAGADKAKRDASLDVLISIETVA